MNNIFKTNLQKSFRPGVTLLSLNLHDFNKRQYLFNGVVQHKQKKYSVFFKIRPMSDSTGVQEEKIYNITNQLLDQGVADTVVYSFTRKFLKSNSMTVGAERYNVLLLSSISNYTSLSSFLKTLKSRRSAIPYDILLQIVYTLHIFNKIGIYHTDLHLKNMYVLRLPQSQQKTVQYSLLGGTSLHIKRVFKVQIIDFDSAVKKRVGAGSLKEAFKPRIGNPESYFRNTNRNNRTNILKVVHSLLSSLIYTRVTDQLLAVGLRSKTGLPFFPRENSISLDGNNKKHLNRYHLTKYGYAVKETDKNQYEFIKLSNTTVHSPHSSLITMSRIPQFFSTSRSASVTFSEAFLHKSK
jgi:hypothetical protein